MGETQGVGRVSGAGRLAATIVVALSCVAATVAFGTVELGAQWLPAWVAASALYTIAGVGLWRGAPWARSLTVGVLFWGLLAWVQSAIACLGAPPLLLAVIGGHAVALLAAKFTPCTLERRHRISMLLAGAAVPGALFFGLAPLQDPTTRLLLVGGATLLFLMTVGLARGRTWGLLFGLAAAPLLVTAAFVAPAMLDISQMLPLLEQPRGFLMMRFVGVVCAVLAVGCVLPFVGPAVRFVRT